MAIPSKSSAIVAADGGESPTAGYQQTIAGEATVHGIGYVTGADVQIRFKPSDADTGVVFVRTDLPGAPRIPALVSHRVSRERRTALEANGATVEMTEHLLAALAGLRIDNCVVEIDGPETPGLDGSALAYVEALENAGVVTQSALRRPLIVRRSVSVSAGDAVAAAHPGPVDSLQITYNLDYPDPAIGKQSLTIEITPENFRELIAPARTFILAREIEALRAQGLGSRAAAADLLVFGTDGLPIDNRLRFPDECVRHKILDVIGDLALLGRPLRGHVFAHKSGHQLNGALAKQLLERQAIERRERLLAAPPLLDTGDIEKSIPHRYPFLFVDRVLEMVPNHRAVGIKNVTCNEPFFQGHWPGRPVMPGVLILESMAQLAGLMFNQWQQEGFFAVLVSISAVRFRKPVVPGDQLWLEADAIKVKRRAAVVKVSAAVQGDLVAEAEMYFVVIRLNDTDTGRSGDAAAPGDGD